MTTQLTWVPLAVLNTAGARDFMQASPDKHHNKVNTEWYKLLPNKPLTSSLPLTQDDQRGYYQQTILDWSRTAIKTRQLAPVVNTLLSLETHPCDSGFRCITCSQSYWQKHMHIPPRPECRWKSKSCSHLKFQNHWPKVFNEMNDCKQMKK